MIHSCDANGIDQTAVCRRSGFVGFPIDLVRVVLVTAHLKAGGFRLKEGMKPINNRNCFGRSDVSLPRYAVHRYRSREGKYVIDARIGSYKRVAQYDTP